MPLLTSPIDGSPMTQINRYGIEIDVCPSSGGVWLDKGELEKIMHILQQEAAVQQSNYKAHKQGHDYKNHKSSHKHHKKEGAISQIMDLFDF